MKGQQVSEKVGTLFPGSKGMFDIIYPLILYMQSMGCFVFRDPATKATSGKNSMSKGREGSSLVSEKNISILEKYLS